ncbi:hypothetical protein GCM10010983_14450 [Caulobacter rhizosphaerae]|nr:hypothetical protein GCM10010983_14450 [Caulobacter rhizosphaerae]
MEPPLAPPRKGVVSEGVTRKPCPQIHHSVPDNPLKIAEFLHMPFYSGWRIPFPKENILRDIIKKHFNCMPLQIAPIDRA